MVSEDPIYEKLNDAVSIRGFVTATVALFDDAVDLLINKIFRKNDFAVKSVVESLFETSGPLAALSIRLKVLLGLGVISNEVFEDITAFLQLKEQLNNDVDEHHFADELILSFAHELQLFRDKDLLPKEEIIIDLSTLVGKMKQQRKENLVRSCLILTVTEICRQLAIESPL
ncbi:MAG: MltR family transcriptional regulator [[Actinobacillus] rossii]|nr:MltR family transcriptional regulator [[Actinobacillus] rossii]MDY4505333.1 MltR family transcriptional regulator [[Actinobacillus] rossii]